MSTAVKNNIAKLLVVPVQKISIFLLLISFSQFTRRAWNDKLAIGRVLSRSWVSIVDVLSLPARTRWIEFYNLRLCCSHTDSIMLRETGLELMTAKNSNIATSRCVWLSCCSLIKQTHATQQQCSALVFVSTLFPAAGRDLLHYFDYFPSDVTRTLTMELTRWLPPTVSWVLSLWHRFKKCFFEEWTWASSALTSVALQRQFWMISFSARRIPTDCHECKTLFTN